MAKITLNESNLQSLIEESIYEVLQEENMDEILGWQKGAGLKRNMKNVGSSIGSGIKQGASNIGKSFNNVTGWNGSKKDAGFLNRAAAAYGHTKEYFRNKGNDLKSAAQWGARQYGNEHANDSVSNQLYGDDAHSIFKGDEEYRDTNLQYYRQARQNITNGINQISSFLENKGFKLIDGEWYYNGQMQDKASESSYPDIVSAAQKYKTYIQNLQQLDQQRKPSDNNQSSTDSSQETNQTNNSNPDVVNEEKLDKIIMKAINESLVKEYKNSEMGWKGQMLKGYETDAQDAYQRQYSPELNKQYHKDNKIPDSNITAFDVTTDKKNNEIGPYTYSGIRGGISKDKGSATFVAGNGNYSINNKNQVQRDYNHQREATYTFNKGQKPIGTSQGAATVPNEKIAGFDDNLKKINNMATDMNDFYSGNYEKRMNYKKDNMKSQGKLAGSVDGINKPNIPESKTRKKKKC